MKACEPLCTKHIGIVNLCTCTMNASDHSWCYAYINVCNFFPITLLVNHRSEHLRRPVVSCLLHRSEQTVYDVYVVHVHKFTAYYTYIVTTGPEVAGVNAICHIELVSSLSTASLSSCTCVCMCACVSLSVCLSVFLCMQVSLCSFVFDFCQLIIYYC